MTDDGVEVRPLTADRWDDLATLFGPSGAYGNCWCTYFRVTGAEFARGIRDRGRGNRDLLRRLTREGEVPGLLAYRGGRAVGWVSVAPRPSYGRILRSPIARPALDDAEDDRTWSVVCFYVPRGERRAGLARLLLGAAVDHARRSGAARLEAYPLDLGGERGPNASLYVGSLELFREAGFREVARAVERRPVVRLDLG